MMIEKRDWTCSKNIPQIASNGMRNAGKKELESKYKTNQTIKFYQQVRNKKITIKNKLLF